MKSARNKLIKDDRLAGRSIAWIAQEYDMEEKAVYAVLERAGVTRPPSAESIRKPRRKEEKDIARRRAVLLGLEPRAPSPRRVIPDEDLLRYGGASLSSYAIEDACAWGSVASCIEPIPRLTEAIDADASRQAARFLAFSR